MKLKNDLFLKKNILS